MRKLNELIYSVFFGPPAFSASLIAALSVSGPEAPAAPENWSQRLLERGEVMKERRWGGGKGGRPSHRREEVRGQRKIHKVHLQLRGCEPEVHEEKRSPSERSDKDK